MFFRGLVPPTSMKYLFRFGISPFKLRPCSFLRNLMKVIEILICCTYCIPLVFNLISWINNPLFSPRDFIVYECCSVTWIFLIHCLSSSFLSSVATFNISVIIDFTHLFCSWLSNIIEVLKDVVYLVVCLLKSKLQEGAQILHLFWINILRPWLN